MNSLEELNTELQRLRNKLQKTERELREERVYSENLIDTLHEPFLVLREDLSVKSANKAFYKHFQVKPGQTLGQFIYDLGNKQWDIPLLRALLDDVLPENNVFENYEVSHHFEQIGMRTMLLNARRLDHVQLILLGIQDITRTKEAEARQAFRLKLSDALRSVSDPLTILDTVSHTTMGFFNTDRCYYCEIVDSMAVIQRDAALPGLPSVRGEYNLDSMPIFKAVVDAGIPIVVEDARSSKYLDENLRQLCLKMQVLAFIDVPVIKGGRVVGVLCITQSSPRKWTDNEVELARDIAERTWSAVERAGAEANLAESEMNFRTLFESMEEGYAIAEAIRDEHGNMINYRLKQVNPAYGKLTGLDPQESMGKTAWDMLPGLDEKWYAIYQRVLESGEPIRMEDYIAPLDSWYSINAFRYQEDQFAVIFDDITERKRRETHQQFLVEIAADFSRLASTDEIMRVVGEKVGVYLNVSNCLFAEIDEDTNQATVTYTWHTPDTPDVTGTYRLSDFITADFRKEARSGETIIVHDTQADTRVNSEGYAALNIYACITVPYHREGKWKYLFTVNDKVARTWRDDEIELIWEITNRTFPRLERAYTEDALRESEARLSAIFREAEAGISEINLEGRFLRVNEKLCRILGRSREELLQLRVEDVTHPDCLTASREALRKLIETGRPASVDKAYQKPDGSKVWANSSLALLKGSPGQPATLLAVTVDLSRQRIAEEALRKSEDRFRLAAKAGKAFSWEMTVPGHQFTYGGDAVGILGLAHEGWLPRTLEEMRHILHPDDQEKIWEELREALEAQDTYTLNFRTRTGQNQFLWIETHARIFRDEQHVPQRVVGIAQNVTQRKKAEAALQRAKEEAEQASRAKDEFLSTMSHEIRTPMNAIISLSDLLLKKEPRPDQQERLLTLKFSSQSLLTLINDILDYSKLEAGKAELEQTTYQLSTLLNSIRQSHQPLAENKKNQLHFDIAEDVPDILVGDPYKLAQVLNNLLSNANKFTQDGSIRLQVSPENKAEEKVALHFRVEDNGIGIAPAKLESIFEKFTQADNTTARRYGGTGLGLSITRSLLQLMGSDIQAQSREGSGTTFYFTLPQQIGRRENLDQHEDRIGDTHRVPDNMRILIAEDTAINRMVLQQHLEDWWQIEADEAENGREAVACAGQQRYDLVLMDIRMPEMDGVEAARQIRRQSENNARMPIIALTADTRIMNLRDGEEQLFDRLVVKPFVPDQLYDTITSLVQGSKASQAPLQAPKDALAVDYRSIEAQFEEPEKVNRFLTIACNALRTFRENYFEAFQNADRVALDNALHKAKLLFDTLGINDLYRQLSDCRERTESHEADALVALREKLDAIIAGLEKRLEIKEQ